MMFFQIYMYNTCITFVLICKISFMCEKLRSTDISDMPLCKKKQNMDKLGWCFVLRIDVYWYKDIIKSLKGI